MRMEQRGDQRRAKWLQVIEVLPPDLIAFIAEEALSGSLPVKEDSQATPMDFSAADSPHWQAPDVSQYEAEKGGFGVASERAASAAESTDAHAGFSETCRNPQRDPAQVEMWARASARSQAGAAAVQWLRINRPDAFDSALYARPQDHPDYLPTFEPLYERFFAEALEDCGARPGVASSPAPVEGATVTADGWSLSSNADAETRKQTEIRLWREHIGDVRCCIEQKKPLDALLAMFPQGNPPPEVKEDYEQLLADVEALQPQAGSDKWNAEFRAGLERGAVL